MATQYLGQNINFESRHISQMMFLIYFQDPSIGASPNFFLWAVVGYWDTAETINLRKH